jgi:hypothetical protein
LLHIYLNIFRHLAQKFLDIRQYACEISIQSDEKSCCVSAQQSLCGVALKNCCTKKLSILIRLQNEFSVVLPQIIGGAGSFSFSSLSRFFSRRA